MYSLLLTFLFYCLAGLNVYWTVPKHVRLLAWGSLPIVWASVLALTGLLETLISLPALLSLFTLFCGLITLIFRKYQSNSKAISFVSPPVTFWILLAFLIGFTARY